MSGCVMESQNFNNVAAYTVNGDVVFVQDQLTRTGNPASPAHARMGLMLGHSGLQHARPFGCLRRTSPFSNQVLLLCVLTSLRAWLMSMPVVLRKWTWHRSRRKGVH
jgi:hypothetical protein